MPARVCSMCFNATGSLLCVSSGTETVHVFKIADGTKQTVATPTNGGVTSSPSSSLPKHKTEPTQRKQEQRRPSFGALSEEDEPIAEGFDDVDASLAATDDQISSRTRPSNPTRTSSADIAARAHDGTLTGMLRRTSQSVGKTFAASVAGYLPSSVTEMLEPARDFAWFKIPRLSSNSSSGTGAGQDGGGEMRGTGGSRGGGGASLRSVVAMSRSAPQVMVVTSEGYFLVFQIDLDKGGEGALVKQYSILEASGHGGTAGQERA